MLTCCSALAMADGGQKVSIGGRTVEKNVTRIEFRGDNVILTYDDASTQTADMSEVEIQFDNATGINSVQVQPKQAYTPGKPTYSLGRSSLCANLQCREKLWEEPDGSRLVGWYKTLLQHR